MPIIEVSHLYKDFKVYQRNKGTWNTAKSLFHRESTVKHAVEDVSFSIDKGEMVGYIGPNGAGKSTTIKMLTGILYPTSGNIIVRGLVPHKNRRENAMHIGVVFGQRSQLYWDLPLSDAFELYRKMYNMERTHFYENVARFTQLLALDEFMNRPVRQLSLGQKMRAELTIALLHDPEIVYLDEPTIGLDIVAKKQIREFIKQINHERKTTVILTTHDMDDIEQICNRLILIDKGRLLYDGSLNMFRDRFAQNSVVEFTCSDSTGQLRIEGCSALEPIENGRMSVAFDTKKTSRIKVVRELMEHLDITDFVVKEPRLEDILRIIYEK